MQPDPGNKMTNKKNKIKGIFGTILFHLLVLLVIIFFGLSTPLPLPGEEGVEVNLGTSDQGTGRIQHEEPTPKKQETPPPTPPQQEEQKEDIITQKAEEAPVIEENKEEKKVEEEKPVEQPPQKVEEKPLEKPEQPKVDPRAIYKGKSTDGTGQNEGETGQPGDQGKPHGDPDVNNHDGLGGAGNGISYSLGGRGAKHLPKPSYISQEQGKIIVTIWVNKEGKVVKAVAGAKGTNIADLRLSKLTKEAALRSIFNPDPNAPDVQKGSITYNFIRIN